MRDIAFTGLVLLSLYHILVLIGLINYDFVWGGYIDNIPMMVILETISLSITCLLIYLIIYIKKSEQITLYSTIGLLFGFNVFLLSLIGNLLSSNDLEKFLGSSVALFYIYYFFFELKQTRFTKNFMVGENI